MSILLKKSEYMGLPLSTTIKNDEGFYREILEAIRLRMDDSLKTHSKVLFLLFTFSYPSNDHTNPLDNIILPDAVLPLGNDVFVYFLNQYIRKLNSYGYDVRYVWVRERSHACDHCHYHLAMWLNGNEIQYFRSLDEINVYWSQALANHGIVASGANTAGLIDRGRYDQNGQIQYYGMIVHRDNDEEKAAVFQRASYLAKVYSKDVIRPARTRRWGCSNR